MNGNQLFAKFFDLTTQFGQKWIFAIILLLLFWFGGIILQTFVTKMAQRKNLNKDFLHLIARTVKIVMVLLGSITALGTLGVDVSALVAGPGAHRFCPRLCIERYCLQSHCRGNDTYTPSPQVR